MQRALMSFTVAKDAAWQQVQYQKCIRYYAMLYISGFFGDISSKRRFIRGIPVLHAFPGRQR